MVAASAPQARRLYVVSAAVGSVCLAVVGVALAWMAAAVRSSMREGRAWWAAAARRSKAPLACRPARVSLQCLPGTPHYLTNYPPTPPSARTNHLPCRDQQHAARRCRSSNQRYFATTAAVLLGGSGALLCMFLAGMAATLAQPDCSYPWVAIAVLEFFRVRGAAQRGVACSRPFAVCLCCPACGRQPDN